MRKYVLIFLVFFISCRQHKAEKEPVDFYPLVADSLRVKMLQGEINAAQLFNLPVIYKGVDSLEIRVRYWDAFGLGINLYVLKVDSLGWKGYHYNSYTQFHRKDDGTEMRYKDRYQIGDSVYIVKNFTPLCGWGKFTDTLSSFKLTQLPTQALIKNFAPIRILDGDGYTIEIATPGSYRQLIYATPELYEYEECKTISKFIAFLRRQMGKDYDWPANLPSSTK